MAVTKSDVEKLDAQSWNSLTDSKKDALLSDAQTESQTIYSGRFARTPTLVGDRDIFVKNLAAHKWELAEGGQPNSESQTGGSTSYDTSPGDSYLEQTRYGQTCLEHLDDRQSIGIVRTY